MLKPIHISPAMTLGGGVSFLQGGLRQFTPAAYRMSTMADGAPGFRPDSLASRMGSRLPRRYRGLNLQWKWNHSKGATELRAEWWKGIQTGTRYSSETPGSPYDPAGVAQPFYVRDFAGGFLLLLQHLGSSRHQMGVKADWYDPNTGVRGERIGSPLAVLGAADVRYTTLGLGYNHVPMENVRLTVWYDIVRNESTRLPGMEGDLPDDVLTVRIQYRFQGFHSRGLSLNLPKTYR